MPRRCARPRKWRVPRCAKPGSSSNASAGCRRRRGHRTDVVAAETKVASAEAEARARRGRRVVDRQGRRLRRRRARADRRDRDQRKASVGMAVQRGGDPLVEIGDSSALWIVADVFERDLPLVHHGATRPNDVSVVHDAMEGRVASSAPWSPPACAPPRCSSPSIRTARRFVRGCTAAREIDARRCRDHPAGRRRAHQRRQGAGRLRPEGSADLRPAAWCVAQPVEGRVQIVSGLSPGDKSRGARRAAARRRGRSAALGRRHVATTHRLCVRRRMPALVVTAAIAAYGVNAYLSLPVEAYPDVTNVQVIVIAQLPARRRRKSSGRSRCRSNACSTARRAPS